MKFKKVAALLLAGIMCAATVVGCGKSDDGKADSTTTPKADESKADDKEDVTTPNAADEEKLSATIKVWSPAEDQDEKNGSWLQTRCDAFNAAHPNWDLKFEYNVCGEDQAATTITTDPSQAADVYMFANDQLNKLIEAGAISRLGGETEQYIKDTNSESMVKTVTVGDAVYGVPYTANTWFMYYDKRVFSEDDVKNLDKMLEVAASKNTKVSFPLSNSWYIASFYVGNGCSFFGDGTDESAGIDFAGDKATAVTNYLIDLSDNTAFMDDSSGAGIAGLKDGSVAAVFSGSWDLGNVKEALGEENVGIAQAPTYTLDGKDVQMKPFTGSKAVAVNKTSENQKVAVQLALWLANEESQQSRYEARGVVPCNTKLLEQDSIKSDALVNAQNGPSIMQPFVSKMGQYWTPAENMGKQIIADMCTHDNAEEMTADMNTAFNKETL